MTAFLEIHLAAFGIEAMVAVVFQGAVKKVPRFSQNSLQFRYADHFDNDNFRMADQIF